MADHAHRDSDFRFVRTPEPMTPSGTGPFSGGRLNQCVANVQRRVDSPGSDRPNCRPGKWLAATRTSFPSSSRVSLSHRVGESLVVVDEEIEVVIHNTEWAVNNVPEQHGAMDPVGDHDDTAPWRVSRRKSHIDPRQQCAVDLPGLDLIEYRSESFCHRDRPVDPGGEEVLVGSRQKMIEVCRRASNRGVRSRRSPRQTPSRCGRSAGG